MYTVHTLCCMCMCMSMSMSMSMSMCMCACAYACVLHTRSIKKIDRTTVNTLAQVETGFSLPGPVRRKVNGLVVGAALPALKRYAESIAPVPYS